MVWIKICGTTNLDDARAAIDAGADALGFIFAASPRRVSVEQARQIIAELPTEAGKIGVFVNEPAGRIHEIIGEAGLTGVQLQGEEGALVIDELRKLSAHRREPLSIYKAVGAGPGMEHEAQQFAAAAEGILLDSFARCRAPGAARGGTGKTFDWEEARTFVPELARHTRVIIAGGLSPDNVAEAVRLFRPWGVDVCSGVEFSPGKKDHVKLRSFVAAARAAHSG